MHKRITYTQGLSIAVFLLFFLSIPAYAQTDDLAGFITDIKNAVYEVVILLYCIVLYITSAAAALLIILTGIKYMSSEDDAGRVESRKRLTYSLIGLLVVALACPLINVFFSGGDIGIPDANGNKVPCPGCPFIWTYTGGGIIEPTPTPTPTPSVSPTPGGTEAQCAKACTDAGKGYVSGKCSSGCVTPDVLLSSFTCNVAGKSKCCCTPPAGGYSSCDAACKDQLDGATAKYTGGTCVVSCSDAGKETYGFACTKEGKPAGYVCCCVKVTGGIKWGEIGAACRHSSECNPDLYCGGTDSSSYQKCTPKRVENAKCTPAEEVDNYGVTLVCKSGLLCWSYGSGGNPYSCITPTCSVVYGGRCCKDTETCVGKKTISAAAPLTDCPDKCCEDCQ